ncbi:MAG: SigE family RNA polymerase sigma factor [Actinomycetota bacterium]|nr:SigE family RNA polymerase sigma factor [Actinomycetota bacterium]
MAIRDRDAEFKSFYFREAGRLRSLALLLTGDPEKAADLTHDALLRAYRAWNRIKNEDPGPYVRRTLVNLCRNDYRRRLVERRKPPAPAVPIASGDASVDEAMRVAEALKVLSPIRKATVVLRFYEDMPEAQIAEVLDRPLNTVKSDLRRALERLRPLLEEGATT